MPPKKINPILFSMALVYTLLVTGCVSFRRYPSAWPDLQPVASPSQLSGIYNREVIYLLRDFMELPVSLPGSYEIRLQVDDSLQCEIIPAASPEISIPGETITEHPQQSEKKFVKKSFSVKKGLQFSYQLSIGGQGVPLGLLRNYIYLNKDKEGNLVIKKGQRCFGLVWLLFPVIENRYEWISVRKNSVRYPSFRLKPVYTE